MLIDHLKELHKGLRLGTATGVTRLVVPYDEAFLDDLRERLGLESGQVIRRDDGNVLTVEEAAELHEEPETCVLVATFLRSSITLPRIPGFVVQTRFLIEDLTVKTSQITLVPLSLRKALIDLMLRVEGRRIDAREPAVGSPLYIADLMKGDFVAVIDLGNQAYQPSVVEQQFAKAV